MNDGNIASCTRITRLATSMGESGSGKEREREKDVHLLVIVRLSASIHALAGLTRPFRCRYMAFGAASLM